MAENNDGPHRGAHLIERAAAQMRAEAGLAAPDPAPDDVAGEPAAARLPREIAAKDVGGLLLAEPPARPAPADDLPPRRGAADGGATEVGVTLDMAMLQRAGLALAGSRSRVTEEYRITVGRILRALRAGNRANAGMANLVMVTSARPGEGKSFSSLNLAASIAQNGLADVLLVDVDGKPRSITTLLGLRDRPGLLDLVDSPTIRPDELVLRTAIEGLSVLPLGLNRASGADGGVTRAVLAALERVRRRFNQHVLLLDTAPCLSTSDPSTLAPVVDQVIMVVEASRTQRSELGAALELVRACSNVILVLNKVRLTHRHSFGSYYYFGYPS
jgi:receptor protein-tyrosine kinase